jgi:hypothetical protein
MVPGTGLEPACLSALAPKASVSANSTIPALHFRVEKIMITQHNAGYAFVPIKTPRMLAGDILVVGVFPINPPYRDIMPQFG